jgi:hypothetical protein
LHEHTHTDTAYGHDEGPDLLAGPFVDCVRDVVQGWWRWREPPP